MLDNFRVAAETLVLDAEGNQVGRMKIGQAKSLAKEQGLDLVEVAKQEGMSVVRIMDRGKWAYDQKKNARKNATRSSPQKEMKFRARIGQHDLKTKIKKVHRFIDKGSDVRLVVEMRGRERANPEVAELFLRDILSHFPDLKMEPLKRTNSNVSTTLHPKKVTNAREEVSEVSEASGASDARKDDKQVGEDRVP